MSWEPQPSSEGQCKSQKPSKVKSLQHELRASKDLTVMFNKDPLAVFSFHYVNSLERRANYLDEHNSEAQTSTTNI